MAVNTVSNIERSKYNDEFRFDFEREKSLLMKAVNSNGLMRAGTIYWDVVGTTSDAAERARDGDIPVDQLDNSQVSDTPKEFFKKYSVDDFDAFRANPNYRAAQYRKARAACYRTCDQRIIELFTSGTNYGTTTLANIGSVLDLTTSLWENDVPNDGRVWGVLTPKALARLMKINEFTSADYVSATGKTEQGVNGYGEGGYWNFMGVKWFMHTGLAGTGTSTATVAVWHEDSIGHQIDGEPELHAYYFEPQDRWETWSKYRDARAMCLPNGCLYATHDDTAAL